MKQLKTKDFFVIPKSLEIDREIYKIELTNEKVYLDGKSVSGLMDPEKKEIVIKTSAKDRTPAEILFHELYHLYCHQFDPDFSTEQRAQVTSKFWLNIFRQLMRHDPTKKLNEMGVKHGKRK